MKETKKVILNDNKEKMVRNAIKQSVIVLFLGIMLSTVLVFTSVTFAWFRESVVLHENNMKSAYFDVDYAITSDGVTHSTDGKYLFDANKVYKVRITATGMANNVHCVFNADENAYYVEQISTSIGDNTVEFAVSFSNDTLGEFVALLGNSNKPVTFENGCNYLDCQKVSDLSLGVNE